MAKQEINIGASANDGTGDPLRTAFDKTNDNFTELYNVLGWGYYQDDESSPATQTINATPSKLQINGLAGATEVGYLPYEIRGSGNLWDTTNDKITPISIGDAYDVRINFEVASETGNPTEIICQLDIGGTGSPTIIIVNTYVQAGKSVPYVVTINFPIFCLNTFVTNGGDIFLSTDTGSATIASRNIFIKRTFNGQI